MADAPDDPEGVKDSLKALGIGDFKGLKTLTNTETGTIYGIIAEAKGLTLSISPRIDARPLFPFVGIYVRVRAQKKEDWANLDAAGELFGLYELIQKSVKHASVEFFTVVGAHPCTPYEVGKVINDNHLFEHILDLIIERVEKAGGKLLAEKSVIRDYMLEQVKDALPTEPSKQPHEFPVMIGPEQISKHLGKLAQEYGYVKKIPKPEQGPGPGDQLH